MAEFFVPMSTLVVPGETHTNIKTLGTRINGYPFLEGHHDVFSSVAIKDDDPLVNGYPPHLYRISKNHGRSFEIRFGNTRAVWWQDYWGNLFGVQSEKGPDLTEPGVMKDDAAPLGIRFIGLQDIAAMFRVCNVSRVMRARGIDTEVITRYVEPSKLPFRGELLEVPDFKQKLRDQVWEKNIEIPEEDLESNFRELGRVDMPLLTKALNETTFFITTRSTQVSERFSDLALAETKEDFLMMVGNAFTFINMEEYLKARRAEKFGEDYQPRYLSTDSEEDVNYYISEYFPKRAGKNYGRMRKIRLAHVYSHTGNVSTIGGLVDADSIKGELTGCGDEPVTDEQLDRDVTYFLSGDGNHGQAAHVLRTLQDRGFIRQGVDLYPRFCDNFNQSYISECGWEDEILFRIEDIYMSFLGFTQPVDSKYINRYLELVHAETGVEYTPRVSISELLGECIDQNSLSFEQFFDQYNQETLKSLAEVARNLRDTNMQDTADMDKLESDLELMLNNFPAVNIARLCIAYYDAEITNFYGEAYTGDELIAFKAMKVARTFQDVLAVYPLTKMEEELQSYLNEQYVKYMGWEDDIVESIGDINRQFKRFSRPEDKHLFDRYMQLLATKLGWDYNWNVDSQEVFRLFKILQKEKMDEYFDREYTAILASESGNALEPLDSDLVLGLGKEALVDHVIDFVNRDFRSKLSQAILSVQSEYGRESMLAVMTVFVEREVIRLIRAGSDEIVDAFAVSCYEDYMAKRDVTLLETPEIEHLMLGIAIIAESLPDLTDEVEITIKQLFYNTKRVQVVSGIPMETYFNLLDHANRRDGVSVRAYTGSKHFSILNGERIAQPRYIFTDGYVHGLDKNHMWDIEDASYVAWIGQGPGVDDIEYNMKSSALAPELRKQFGKGLYPHVSLSCKYDG